MSEAERFSMRDPAAQTEKDRAFADGLEAYYAQSLGSHVDKLRNFPKYVPRQALSMFLARHELFQLALTVHGYIVECGVFLGGGLMTWAQLSAIYEPVNHVRRIVGFDTFTGFVDIHDKDRGSEALPYAEKGGLAVNAYDDLRRAIELYDTNRPIGHIPRVELVRGDATRSIEEYVKANPHLVVALLYLDFDLYEPTKAALSALLPRMPRGAVLAFDELNQRAWPGETVAVLETVGLSKLRIKRFPYASGLSYAVIE